MEAEAEAEAAASGVVGAELPLAAMMAHTADPTADLLYRLDLLVQQALILPAHLVILLSRTQPTGNYFMVVR
jgi:hypothetical protein